MAVEPGLYILKVIARSSSIPELRAELIDSSNQVLCETRILNIESDWTNCQATLSVSETASGCKLRLSALNDGTIDFDYVSLLPQNAHRGIINPHLYKMLQDLSPAFVRFPGGCIVEGMCLDNAWNFEPTLGAPEDRPGCWNLWNYRRSDGLG